MIEPPDPAYLAEAPHSRAVRIISRFAGLMVMMDFRRLKFSSRSRAKSALSPEARAAFPASARAAIFSRAAIVR
jgi:hypothetical protein